MYTMILIPNIPLYYIITIDIDFECKILFLLLKLIKYSFGFQKFYILCKIY